MSYIMIAVSVCFFCLNGAMTRFFQLRLQRAKCEIRLYQAGFCLIASLLNLIFYGIKSPPSLQTLLLAAVFGIFFAVACLCGAECYERGPMSLTSVIINLSLAVPVLYSVIAFKEGISIAGIAGLILLCVTFVLSAFSQKGKGSGISFIWLALVFIAFIANGLTAVLQKLNQLALDGKSDGAFLTIAYAVSAMVFGVCFLVAKGNYTFSLAPVYVRRFALLTLLAGGGSFVGNAMLNVLSVRVDAAVLYPCVNGGLAVLTSLVSAVFFKEKISAVKMASILVGIAAIVLLTI